MSQTTIEGEYYFRQTEMVAGFKFAKDGKFQFFYSYGAVDRSATGTFTIKDDSLVLTSDKEPGKDFAVSEQGKKGKGYTLMFKDSNSYLVKNIVCLYVINGEAREAYTDDDGQVHIDADNCDTIYAVHQLYPDVPTIIKDQNNQNNYFVIELQPTLEQVSFKGVEFSLTNEKKIRMLNNYFIDAKEVEFSKTEE